MVAQLDELLGYPPECSKYDSRWGHWDWRNPSARFVVLGSTELATEMSTRIIPWG